MSSSRWARSQTVTVSALAERFKGNIYLCPSCTVLPNLAIWSGVGKISPRKVITITSGSYKGVPFLVGGKYFFMPQKANTIQWYGQLEIGLFFGSYTVPAIPGVTIPGVGTFGGTSETSVSSTDFVFSPSVGMEYPMSKGSLDASINYFLIASTGSAGSIGLRVGYKFPL